MAYDPVVGGATPDKANAGRLKLNAMAEELDSRLAVVEGIHSSHRIFESQVDVTSNTTAYMDTGLAFPVIGGDLYHFFAMIIFSAQSPGVDSPEVPPGYQQNAKFSVSGPGSTPSPVSWLHYWLLPLGAEPGYEPWAKSEYDSGSLTYIGRPHASAGETSDEVAFMHGFVQPPTSGTFKFRFGSAFNQDNGIVVRAGSTVEVW